MTDNTFIVYIKKACEKLRMLTVEPSSLDFQEFNI